MSSIIIFLCSPSPLLLNIYKSNQTFLRPFNPSSRISDHLNHLYQKEDIFIFYELFHLLQHRVLKVWNFPRTFPSKSRLCRDWNSGAELWQFFMQIRSELDLQTLYKINPSKNFLRYPKFAIWKYITSAWISMKIVNKNHSITFADCKGLQKLYCDAILSVFAAVMTMPGTRQMLDCYCQPPLPRHSVVLIPHTIYSPPTQIYCRDNIQ